MDEIEKIIYTLLCTGLLTVIVYIPCRVLSECDEDWPDYILGVAVVQFVLALVMMIITLLYYIWI